MNQHIPGTQKQYNSEQQNQPAINSQQKITPAYAAQQIQPVQSNPVQPALPVYRRIQLPHDYEVHLRAARNVANNLDYKSASNILLGAARDMSRKYSTNQFHETFFELVTRYLEIMPNNPKTIAYASLTNELENTAIETQFDKQINNEMKQIISRIK